MPDLKIILLGDRDTGKSSLLKYFITRKFLNDCSPTLYPYANIISTVHDVRLTIIDIPECANLNSIYKGFLSSANAIVVNMVLPYPGDYYQEAEYLSRCKEVIKKWMTVCQTFAQGIPVILTINKSDLFKSMKLNPPLEALDAMAKQEFDIKELCVTSVKGNDYIPGINVKELFAEAIKYALEYQQAKLNITKPATLPASEMPAREKTIKNLPRKLKRSNGWDDGIWLLIAGLVLATLWFILFPPASFVSLIMPIALGMELGNLGILLLAAEAALAVGLCAWLVYEIAKWTFSDTSLDKLPQQLPQIPAQKPISTQSAASVQVYTAMPATSYLLKKASHGQAEIASKPINPAVNTI